MSVMQYNSRPIWGNLLERHNRNEIELNRTFDSVQTHDCEKREMASQAGQLSKGMPIAMLMVIVGSALLQASSICLRQYCTYSH